MRVCYTDFVFGKHGQQVGRRDPVEEFVVDQLLYREDSGGYTNRIPLEDQSVRVAGAMGRLLNILLEKGIVSPEQFHKVVDTRYHLKDRCEIKAEE
jgi:hypothetical protein